MILKNFVKPNCYQDSVVLMTISSKIKELPGVKEVSVLMGTNQNKELLKEVNLLDEEGVCANPNDLIISILAEDYKTIEDALNKVEEFLNKKETQFETEDEYVPHSQEMAFEIQPLTNMVIISVPGKYASWEAQKALERNCNVMIFSDNVPIEEELRLKTLAKEKDLIVMGPDCGTAIINGVALGFANVVRKGEIGIVGASGTGIQQVSTIISNNGAGISQAIGTGGRDLSEKIGGISMLSGIKALELDPETKVIVIISKPPAKEVSKNILNFIKNDCKKPFVINFLGEKNISESDRIFFTQTLEDTAYMALNILNKKHISFNQNLDEMYKLSKFYWEKLNDNQKYIRGLFSGGSLCDESLFILKNILKKGVYSNLSLEKEWKLKDSKVSQEHTLIDLGDDEFTVGRPHPMIDFNLRNERILQECSDKETAVILLDIVLGFGAHINPAEALTPVIKKVKSETNIPIVCSICGTNEDPQDLNKQKNILQGLGVIVCPTNAQATKIAAIIVMRNIPDLVF